jgi:hypothetical protein
MVIYAYVAERYRQPGDFEYWGYLHQNGTLQVKRWFGDVKDYTEDCEDNIFVDIVVPPFWAKSEAEAVTIIREAISRRKARKI